MDLVSVIIPFYKKKLFISDSVNSVLNQTYQNFELIIIYDDTETIDLEYILKIQSLDKRIKIVKNLKNMGAGLSRNIGISNSNGNYIAFLDADDIWFKNKLETQLNFMKNNNISISFTSYEIINNKKEILKLKKAPKLIDYKKLILNCDIGLSTVILKKELINDECKFPNLKTKEDFVLWLNIAKKTDIFGLDIPLTKWRKLRDSLSSNFIQKFFDGYKVYNKYMKFGYFKSFYYLIILSINYMKKNLKLK